MWDLNEVMTLGKGEAYVSSGDSIRGLIEGKTRGIGKPGYLGSPRRVPPTRAGCGTSYTTASTATDTSSSNPPGVSGNHACHIWRNLIRHLLGHAEAKTR